MNINIINKLDLHFRMLRMRKIEEKISSEYSKQEMRCPVHLSIGQEAIACGITKNLKKNDKVFSAHRSHYHYLGKGGNLNSMIAELFGKETGCAGGKGGSMHLIDLKAGLFAAVPIVGSTIPIGVGLAWANKINKKNDLVVIFFGEGSTEEGVFYESINFASIHKLKVLFVCENNFYSVYSGLKNRQPHKRSLIKIANSMGLNSKKFNGNDVEKVFIESKTIIKNIKTKNLPFLIELTTYRHLEHCGPFKDDNLNYRPKNELKYWFNQCPVTKYQNKLLKKGILNKKILENLNLKIDKEINYAFKKARFDKFPNKNKLFTNIYA
tara:strand:- start:3056 stop:4027 length:972 start_codon:yes stop_codon:yes gene_type:complete